MDPANDPREGASTPTVYVGQTASELVIDGRSLTSWDKVVPQVVNMPYTCKFNTKDDIHGPVDMEHIETNDYGETVIEPKYEKSPFPLNQEVNSKIVIWQGDITTLQVDAIVHTTNETFTDQSKVSTRIMDQGGAKFKSHIKNNVRTCKTGEIKVSKGFDLPATYVIHTVGPKYQEKYHTAAEGALFSCYNHVLTCMMEKGLKVIAIGSVHSVRRDYPPSLGTCLALRVIRRFLDKYGDHVDRIVLALEVADYGVYQYFMPRFFPRNKDEEETACYFLPEDLGGDMGEPQLPERFIRITSTPTTMTSWRGEDFESSVDLHSGLDSSVIVGRTSFAHMQPSVDTHRQALNPDDPLVKEVTRRNKYERLLRLSQQEDFSDFDAMRFLYVCPSKDNFDTPVVVVVGCNMPCDRVDESHILAYAIKVLDRITSREYSVVFVHTLAVSSQMPSYVGMKYFLELIEERYFHNLRGLHIVNSSLFTRLLVWTYSTFSATYRVKKKIFFLNSLSALDPPIPVSILMLPQEIVDFDKSVSYHPLRQ